MHRVALLACLSLAMTAAAAEPLESGVPPGKRPGPYSFLVATGKERGQPTCFICDQADKPGAVVFARTLSDPLGKLMLELDREMSTRKEFKAWMTLLTPAADLDALAKWSASQGLKNAPVGAFEDADGPPAYTLHKDADVTVMIFEKKKVLLNQSWRAGTLTDTATFVSEMHKALAK